MNADRRGWGMVATLLLTAALLYVAALPGEEERPAPRRPAPRPHAAIVPFLTATLRDGSRSVTVHAPSPDFALGGGETLHPALDPQTLTAEWRGLLRVTNPGSYRFSAPAVGTVAVRVGGRDALAGPIALDAGDHPLAIEFTRTGPEARLQVRWECEAFVSEPIPVTAFWHSCDGENAAADRYDRGRFLVENLNCFGCHSGGAAGRRGPDLTDASRRADARWIYAWLGDPRRVRPDAVMPAMLTGDERRDVAAFLGGTRGADPPTDRFRRRQGRDLFVSVGCVACHRVEESDVPGPADGVLLAGLGSKTDPTAMATFLQDPASVNPSGLMPSMALTPDEALLIGEFLTQYHRPEWETGLPDGASADRGRQVVARRGCLACHTYQGMTNELPARPAQGAGGCLVATPPPAAPRFGLAAEDRRAIAEFFRGPAPSPAPVHDLRRDIAAFRCAACHTWDGGTGLTAEMRSEMIDLGAGEMGGTDPPPLSEAPFKLRRRWIDDVLLRERRIRPWMNLRMPSFGPAAERVGHALPLASGAPAEEDEPPRDRALAARGIALLGKGEGALSCVSCHDFRGQRSLGTRGPDMTLMHARMRPEWFRRWLHNPQHIEPGTPMPQFFSGRPEAEIAPTLDTIWAALSLGPGMPFPPGMEGAGPMLLAVADAPVVLRTFLPGCSPRSFAVGLPGGVSYAFDAGECRLRYAWSGGFLDVSPVWGGRGGTPAGLQGRVFFRAPERFPLRFGEVADWNAAPRLRFIGYETRGTPTVIYEADGHRVHETVEGADGPGLVRRFEIDSAEPVWFAAHEGGGARSELVDGPADATWDGGVVRIPPAEPVRFAVRTVVGTP